MSNKPFVSAELIKCAETFEERNAMYGDTYKHNGELARILFVKPVTLRSYHDFRRFGLAYQIISKLQRYCANFENGGHEDSLHDLSVYAQMLQELDHEASQK